MAPPKKPNHIAGQASLAGFFSGKGLSKLPTPSPPPVKPAKASSSSASPSKASGSKASSNGTAKNQSPGVVSPKATVTVVNKKISVSGWKPSPSPSPSKASSMPAKPSKYFASSGSSRAGKGVDDAIDLDDSSDDDVKPRASASKAKLPPKTTPTKPSSKSNGASAQPAKKGSASKRKAVESSSSESDLDDEDVKPSKPVKKAAKASPAKGSSKASPANKSKAAKGKASSSKMDVDSDDDDDDYWDHDDVVPAKKASSASSAKAKAAPAKAPAKGKGKTTKAKDDDDDEDEDKAAAEAAKKEALRIAMQQKKVGQLAPGSKEVPEGTPGCLLGLTIVFTGELDSLSREEATDIAKRYGAKVTTSPSSKTSYVVMGRGAGPSKLAAIKKSGLKTLDEDGFLDLIRSRSKAPPSKEALEMKKKEEDKIRAAAAKLEPNKSLSKEQMASALWTVRYAPSKTSELIGNPACVNKIQDWLRDWPKSLACGFKKPGKNAINIYRGLLISGPPGIGKTTAAHMLARNAGFVPIELNASDTRSKKLIESSLKDTINNTSLDAWHRGGKIDKSASADGVKMSDKTCLIMDEVDGMSGGDRGGVGAIAALIKKTKVPIICIANDASTPKMKPLVNVTGGIKFSRPTAAQIRSRIMTIAFREKIKLSSEVVDQLCQYAASDIRMIINMLSTWSLTSKTMSFDEGKELGMANQKPGMHTPWTLYSELSKAGTWTSTSKKTLNDKAELYFNDHSIMPLMVQHNYLNSNPIRAQEVPEKKRSLHVMKLAARAADSISDGEVIDGMIHGPQQQWSLMPLHAISSTVAPIYHMHGPSEGWPSFPAFLGMNSKMSRLTRCSVELQAKMRLTASANRHEIRQQYLPYFFTSLTKPLIDKQKDGVDEVVSTMDEYMIGLEDRDVIIELGLEPNDGEAVLKKIQSATKAAFTRRYNGMTHPVAFYKATDFGGGKKATLLKGEPAPDVEEAVEVESAGDVSADEAGGGESDDDGVDLAKNKMVKQKNAAKGKGKSKA